MSPDIDPSLKGSVLSEADGKIQTIVLQGIRLAKRGNIELTPEEASTYSVLRTDPKGWSTSDQRLMAESLLKGERLVDFMRAFPNIFPSH